MNAIVVVPAYEPDERLVAFVRELGKQRLSRVIVVDDGSGERFRPVFAALEDFPYCVTLIHGKNRGKGAALKTAYDYIWKNFDKSVVVVTADADGQHTPGGCRRIAETAAENEGALILGVRNFAKAGTPFRSRLGNRWSTLIFGLVHGRWIADTQTGLRAFSSALLPFMISVKGDRYEYEMGVLMAAARKGLQFVTMPIRTIYEEGNASSHFSPLKDSLRINFLVLKDFLRFAGVSILSFVLDQGLAWAFAAMMAAANIPENAMIWCSGFSARVLSAGFNFAMNRVFVFGHGGKASASAWRYAILCVSVIILSNAGVMLLVALDMPRGLSKFLCDTFLYFAGYRIQARWVFSVN